MIQQAGSVPFRKTDSGFEILLITTRKGKWSLPKGIIDPGETPEETAAKETFEEAGVTGEIVGQSFGSFTYKKWGGKLNVDVFLLKVDEILSDYPESNFRSRRWFQPDEAASQIRKRMRQVLSQAIDLLREF